VFVRIVLDIIIMTNFTNHLHGSKERARDKDSMARQGYSKKRDSTPELGTASALPFSPSPSPFPPSLYVVYCMTCTVFTTLHVTCTTYRCGGARSCSVQRRGFVDGQTWPCGCFCTSLQMRARAMIVACRMMQRAKSWMRGRSDG
jgi:hypothetical protein